MLVALELQYRVHDMFQHFGPRQRSFFIDMPDDDKGDVTGLGELQNARRALAYLR